MTRSITLEERDEVFIESQLATGRYNDPSEVVRDGLRLLEERQLQRAALDAAIERGIADIDAGRSKPLHEVTDRLKTKYRAMADKRSA